MSYIPSLFPFATLRTLDPLLGLETEYYYITSVCRVASGQWAADRECVPGQIYMIGGKEVEVNTHCVEIVICTILC